MKNAAIKLEHSPDSILVQESQVDTDLCGQISNLVENIKQEEFNEERNSLQIKTEKNDENVNNKSTNQRKLQEPMKKPIIYHVDDLKQEEIYLTCQIKSKVDEKEDEKDENKKIKQEGEITQENNSIILENPEDQIKKYEKGLNEMVESAGMIDEDVEENDLDNKSKDNEHIEMQLNIYDSVEMDGQEMEIDIEMNKDDNRMELDEEDIEMDFEEVDIKEEVYSELDVDHLANQNVEVIHNMKEKKENQIIIYKENNASDLLATKIKKEIIENDYDKHTEIIGKDDLLPVVTDDIITNTLEINAYKCMVAYCTDPCSSESAWKTSVLPGYLPEINPWDNVECSSVISMVTSPIDSDHSSSSHQYSSLSSSSHDFDLQQPHANSITNQPLCHKNSNEIQQREAKDEQEYLKKMKGPSLVIPKPYFHYYNYNYDRPSKPPLKQAKNHHEIDYLLQLQQFHDYAHLYQLRMMHNHLCSHNPLNPYDFRQPFSYAHQHRRHLRSLECDLDHPDLIGYSSNCEYSLKVNRLNRPQCNSDSEQIRVEHLGRIGVFNFDLPLDIRNRFEPYLLNKDNYLESYLQRSRSFHSSRKWKQNKQVLKTSRKHAAIMLKCNKLSKSSARRLYVSFEQSNLFLYLITAYIV